MTRKKFVIILAFVLIVLAFPISLVLRELYELSDALGIAIPSFIFGIGIGLIISSVFIPSGNRKFSVTSSNKQRLSKESTDVLKDADEGIEDSGTSDSNMVDRFS